MIVAVAASRAALIKVRRGIMRVGVGAARARFVIWPRLLGVRILRRCIGHRLDGVVHRTRTFTRTGAHYSPSYAPAKPDYGQLLKGDGAHRFRARQKNSRI